MMMSAVSKLGAVVMTAISLVLAGCTGSGAPSTRTTTAIIVTAGTSAQVIPTAVAGAAGGLWLVETYPCATGKCSALLRSTDGGSTWTLLSTLRFAVTALEFANAEDGYAFTTAQVHYWTNDAGRLWQPVPLATSSPLFVTTTTRAYAVINDCSGEDNCDVSVVSSAVSSDKWTTTAGLRYQSAFRNASVAAFGSRVWLIGLTGSGGTARLLVSNNEGRSFDPLSTRGINAMSCNITATSVMTIWGYCATGLMGYGIRSVDGGRSFVHLQSPVSGYSPNVNQIRPVSNMVALCECMNGAGLWTGFVTRDGGHHFSSMPEFPALTTNFEVAFATPALWFVLGSTSNGTGGRLWRTTNSGRTWQPVKPPTVQIGR